MKRLLAAIAATALLVTCANAARQNALEKEMEDYARDFYRAHPKAAGHDSARDAREKMCKDAKQYKLLELSKEDQKRLRKREDIVGKGIYSTQLEELKSLNSKDPKITFLIKYAETPNIKPVEKLLAYRLMKHNFQKAASDAAMARQKRIATIVTKYTAYKAANNGKPPASLNDLDLPEDCKQFTNSKGEKVDWIYIGHLSQKLSANNSHIIIAEPEPLGDVRICGMDDGNVIPFKNSQLQTHLDNILKGGGSAGNGGQSATAGALTGFMKRYQIYKELNNGDEPSSIEDLNLKEGEDKYTDPATGDKLDWIFLGKSSRIRVSEGVMVIVAAPRDHNGSRLVGLSNGKVAVIPETQIGPMLKR